MTSNQSAENGRMDDAIAELVAAARAMLEPIEHEGPCINYDGQNPEWYDEYDSCSRHLAAAQTRKDRLAAALQQFDGTERPYDVCPGCGAHERQRHETACPTQAQTDD